MLLISGGERPIPDSVWRDFTVRFPWQKNLDRNLLFDRTYFPRSPGTSPERSGQACYTIREYQDYTWMELAEPVAVDYISAKTDVQRPAPEHLCLPFSTMSCKQALKLSSRQSLFWNIYSSPLCQQTKPRDSQCH
ncbi:MAG: hypothetical protein AAF632_21890 [Bacteroidota bacterium]